MKTQDHIIHFFAAIGFVISCMLAGAFLGKLVWWTFH
jgi:hypothetical protein